MNAKTPKTQLKSQIIRQYKTPSFLKSFSTLPGVAVLSLTGVLLFAAFAPDLQHLDFSVTPTGFELTIKRDVGK